MTAFSRKETIALALVLLLSCSWLVSGRYLPTRSDPTNRERMKELIRGLLDLAREDYNNAGEARSSNFPFDYQHASSIAKRSVQEPRRSLPNEIDKQ